MILPTNIDDVGIIANGDGAVKPVASISGRQVPSCEITIT